MAEKEVHNEAQKSYDDITLRHAKQEEREKDKTPKPFRNFNNFVKKDIIQLSLDAQHADSTSYRVLDLASGRGGDLGKWVYGRSPSLAAAAKNKDASANVVAVEVYHAYDISPACIAEANTRYESLQSNPNPSFPITTNDVHFGVANCFQLDFWETLIGKTPASTPNSIPPIGEKEVEESGGGAGPSVIKTVPQEYYNVISIQFAFHYGCYSREAVSNQLASISAALTKGGIFIATIVDAEELSKRFVADGERQGENLSNELFDIKFDRKDLDETLKSTTKSPKEGSKFMLPLGSRYHFLLEGHVDCDEFCIPFEDLEEMAAKHSLKSVKEGSYKFKDKLGDYLANPKNKKQLQLTPFSEAEKELVSLYRTACFRKV